MWSAASAHQVQVCLPTPKDWFQKEPSAEASSTNPATVMPVLILFDKSGNAMTDQDVGVETPKDVVEVVPWSAIAPQKSQELKWRMSMVIALQIVHEWSIRACGGDVRSIELRRDNGKLSVFSTVKWEKGELLMVPVVDGMQYIQLQKKKKALGKVGNIILARARGEEPVNLDEVWVLCPCLKLPRKGARATDQHNVTPAWTVKHKWEREGCNMEKISVPVDLVNTFVMGEARQHATSAVVSVPVFQNCVTVLPGEELLAHWDETIESKVVQPCRDKSKVTWRSSIPQAKAPPASAKKTKPLVDSK